MFNNEAYEPLLRDLMNDAFYANTSNRGKIAKIRQCAEVALRRILLLPQGSPMTLGQRNIQTAVSNLNNPLLTAAIININRSGNASTHTQDLSEKTEEDVDSVVDSLFDLYSYLMIAFFEKHPFGSNPLIMKAFSLLPPIIRYKALSYLYTQKPDNVFIIDKLALATLKAKSREDALEWVDTEANHLKSLPSMTEDGKRSILNHVGDVLGREIIDSSPDMYDLCLDKINLVGNEIDKEGKVYYDFETALPYYKKHGILTVNSPEEAEFNSIMEFLYLGRKENCISISTSSS